MPDLRRLRESAALSQRELAQKAGVSRATIAAAELGTRKPHPSTVRKLATALGLHPAEIEFRVGRG